MPNGKEGQCLNSQLGLVLRFTLKSSFSVEHDAVDTSNLEY